MTRKGGKPRVAETKRILNRRASHDYFIHETLDCGIVLRGTEVKAARGGQVSLAESFARVEPATMELWLWQADFGRCASAPADRQHLAKERRKLLAHRREIRRLHDKTLAKGMTLVPLEMYFNERGLLKVKIGLASGKADYDKRQTLRKKTSDREIRQAMTRKRL